MTAVEKAFAPAKINLTLHVTGQREDGHHLLDSLCIFASVGDKLTVTHPGSGQLTVKGPMADGVPVDDSNLVLKAAALMGETPDIILKKRLPNAAGLGGGSGDAAAVLRVLSQMTGKPVPENGISLGADVPLCLAARTSRMSGIGERITPVPGLPALHAVLVNPRVAVPTPQVFRRLENKTNPPMPDVISSFETAADLVAWLTTMRNDLEAPAIAAAPVIQQVFDVLSVTPGCLLTRMSGSGSTCFGLYSDAETAGAAAGRLQQNHPGWWVVATELNGPPKV